MSRVRGAPIVLVCGWLAFLLYAYPGFMSPDSYGQLAQARDGVYTDWHPPAMALLWRWLDAIWAGPFPMLVLQSTLLLAGVYALLARVLAPMRAAIVAVAILLFPPVLTPMAVIWKDSLMAGLLLAGAAALLSPRRAWRVVGCVLIFWATAVRHNALAATLPIVVLLFQARGSWTGWRRYAVATAVWLAITASAMAVNKRLTTHADYPWHNSVALFDIAGVVRFSHETDDAKLRALLADAPLAYDSNLARRFRAVYTPSGHYELTHDDTRVFNLPSIAQLAGTQRAWLHAVTTHPRAFLYHRWQVFRALVGLSQSPGPVWHGQPDGIPSHTPVQHAWISALLALRKAFLFRVYVYLAVALALLAMCRARVPFALLASGLLLELSLFAAAPSPDYRYSHWLIVMTVIAGVLIFVQRYRGARVGRCLDGSVSHSGSSAPPAGSPGSR